MREKAPPQLPLSVPFRGSHSPKSCTAAGRSASRAISQRLSLLQSCMRKPPCSEERKAIRFSGVTARFCRKIAPTVVKKERSCGSGIWAAARALKAPKSRTLEPSAPNAKNSGFRDRVRYSFKAASDSSGTAARARRANRFRQ